MSNSRTKTTDYLTDCLDLTKLWAARRAVAERAPHPLGSRAYYLDQAKTDAHEAWIAIQAGDWLRADIFLKLAIDEIKDAGVLP